jgi:hypothetical protein
MLPGETDRIRTSSLPQSTEEIPPFISESHRNEAWQLLVSEITRCETNKSGRVEA